MELKKNPEANLEVKRKTFFLTGLTFALAASLVAFEWTTYYEIKNDCTLPGDNDWVVETHTPIVILEQEVKPEPKPKKRADVKPTEKVPEIIVKKEVDPRNELPDLASLNLDFDGVETVEFEVVENPDPFAPIEKMPSYYGGDEARIKFLLKNINLKGLHLNKKIKGTVYVEFVVLKNGKLTNFKIAKGVHPEVDAIVLAAAKKMPNWIPGEQRNRKVKAGLRMPVKINLQ